MWTVGGWAGGQRYSATLFPEMHRVLIRITSLRQHDKTHQHQVMLKWPELQSNNGNQTPNLNFVFPKLGKWKVFNMKLFSTFSPSSPGFQSFLPFPSLPLLSLFLKHYLYYICCVSPFGIPGIHDEESHKAWAGNLRRKGVLLKRPPELWEYPKYTIALGNDGTNILSGPLEMEKGKIKVLIIER